MKATTSFKIKSTNANRQIITVETKYALSIMYNKCLLKRYNQRAKCRLLTGWLVGKQRDDGLGVLCDIVSECGRVVVSSRTCTSTSSRISSRISTNSTCIGCSAECFVAGSESVRHFRHLAHTSPAVCPSVCPSVRCTGLWCSCVLCNVGKHAVNCLRDRIDRPPHINPVIVLVVVLGQCTVVYC